MKYNFKFLIMKFFLHGFISVILLLVALSCEKLERDRNAFEFDSYSINFESINDHLITPGENLRIGINYNFYGSYPLSATFSISSTSSFVYCEPLTASLSSGGAYNHHPLSYPSGPHGFLVQIADNAPNGTTIPISVTIVDDLGNQTGGTFSLVVGEAW